MDCEKQQVRNILQGDGSLKGVSESEKCQLHCHLCCLLIQQSLEGEFVYTKLLGIAQISKLSLLLIHLHLCHGFTPATSQAPCSHSFTPHQQDQGRESEG